ncbi:GNAT family N-acetyltransferase [Candidatus Kaiserbacteria bacterium]|nr:GNAT family N-acetyltransferase [Candidatus Kaiserbacteria bacterium]
MSEMKDSLGGGEHALELEEQVEKRHGDIYINLYEKNKKREWVEDPEDKTKKIEKPAAFAKLHEYEDFFYIKYMYVDPEYREKGIGSKFLHPKIKRFLDAQTGTKKLGLRFSERSYDHAEPEIAADLGWKKLSSRPWYMYVPEGASMPDEERVMQMILTAAPEYEEYLVRSGARGVTLIDTIVGTALLVLVFVGITAAFQLSVDVVTNNKARAGAIALANERIEYIRSLPYDSVGTTGGVPAGTIVQTEAVELNGISYTRRTIILYRDDPKDGTGAGDTNANTADYKAAKTEVSWVPRQGGLRKISLTTRVSPIGIEQAVPGGTLALSILNAGAAPVPDAQVFIQNNSTFPTIQMTLFSDANGNVTVIGAPASAGYRIVVSKSGYSTAQTYDSSAENTNPTPGHLTVALNQTTSFPFSIDVISIKNVRTFSPVESSTTTDPLNDSSSIADIANVEIVGGSAKLVGPAPHSTPGHLRSTAIAPTYLQAWRMFNWSDVKPAQTNILHRLYSGDGSQLIPDEMVPGNSLGFSMPPIDISLVSTTTYPSLALHATLGTADENTTPELLMWEVSYDEGPIPLPNITFGLKGAKTIGNGPGGLVYKYSTTTLATGATAGVGVGNLEYDTYTTTVDSATGYDIASSCEPQPESLPPNTYQETKLILVPHTTNSLLVDVRANNALVPNATVRLYRSPGYNITETADYCGQAFFEGLGVGTQGGGNPYSIEVSAPGYATFNAADVNVSGTSRLSVVLN